MVYRGHSLPPFQDSITFPEEGANRGSCVFAQTSVMRSGTSRDTRQQSRLIRGNKVLLHCMT